MESLVLPVIVTLAGAYFFVRNLLLLRDESKLLSYVQTSPKAKRWVQKHGVEQTVRVTKKYFLPLGLVIAGGLFGVGLWSLSQLL